MQSLNSSIFEISALSLTHRWTQFRTWLWTQDKHWMFNMYTKIDVDVTHSNLLSCVCGAEKKIDKSTDFTLNEREQTSRHHKSIIVSHTQSRAKIKLPSADCRQFFIVCLVLRPVLSGKEFLSLSPLSPQTHVSPSPIAVVREWWKIVASSSMSNTWRVSTNRTKSPLAPRENYPNMREFALFPLLSLLYLFLLFPAIFRPLLSPLPCFADERGQRENVENCPICYRI